MADLNLDLKIAFDLSTQLELSKSINAQVFPLMNQAVRAIASSTANEWRKNIYGAKLWMGEKDAYAKTITWAMTGDFSALVKSDYKYDEDIENGRPARDLKQMLNTSTKVRRTEDGRRFLIIPLRHNVAKLQAAGLYGLAAELTASTITGQGLRDSGETTILSPKTGMFPAKDQSPYLSNPATKQAYKVNRNEYNWGDSLKRKAMKDAGLDRETQKWAAGMYRFDTSTPGGGKSSSYLTFRVMMEGSNGWVVPSQPGQYLARKTVETIRPKAEQAFAEAIKRTFG